MIAQCSTYDVPGWVRVSRQRPCPICHKPDGCLIGITRLVCLHVESADPVPWGLGGWYHDLPDLHTRQPIPFTPRQPAPATPASPIADDVLRDQVYSDLLRLAPLSAVHRALLSKEPHGLSEQAMNRYGSLPVEQSARERLVVDLERAHGRDVLLSCPGFYAKSDGTLTIAGAGIILPCRALDGKITSIQIRRDTVGDGQARYYGLSGAGHGGPSCGSAAHVARPHGGIKDARTVYVSEGCKKADVAADHYGAVCIGLPGVGTFEKAYPLLAQLAGDVLVIALDQDVKPAAQAAVERATAGLAAAAIRLGYCVRVAVWDSSAAKGIDDAIHVGVEITVERHTPEPATPERASAGSAPPLLTPTEDGDRVAVPATVLALVLDQARQTATLRAKYQRMAALLRDGRLKPGDKVLAAAIWDELPPPTADGTPPPLRKVYRARLAERAGLSVDTVSRKLPDLHAMGLIQHESRQAADDTRELYLAAGYLPPTSESADTLNGRAANREKDRLRKRCPHCWGTHLRGTRYECEDCRHECSRAEAERAGKVAVETAAGALVHRDTGEVLRPAPAASTPPADSAVPPRAAQAAGECAVPTPAEQGSGSVAGGDESAELWTGGIGGTADSALPPQPAPAASLAPVPPRPDARPPEPTDRCPKCGQRRWWYSERWHEWMCDSPSCQPQPSRVRATATSSASAAAAAAR